MPFPRGSWAIGLPLEPIPYSAEDCVAQAAALDADWLSFPRILLTEKRLIDLEEMFRSGQRLANSIED